MDVNCVIQGTDYNPNYDNLISSSNNITKFAPLQFEDEDYEILIKQSSDVQQVTTNFGIAEESKPVDIPNVRQDDVDYSSPSVDLETFLSRPVRIASYIWADNATFSQAFSPWLLYFNNAAVKKKLDNFAYIRCNLHVKFIVNASPFYYGTTLAAYRPLSNLATSDFYEPSLARDLTGLEQGYLMAISQRPHVLLDAAGCVGGTMTLPFLFPRDWLRIGVAKDFESMGYISLRSMAMILLNANGILGTGCDIKVYAWATDVKLSGATVALSMQSKDEYGKGVVSKPASAVARFMGKYTNYPIIGPYATATSIAAQATANIASLFGYTDVPVVSDVQPFQAKSAPNFAATDIGIPLEKLTIDAKNELTIDPKSLGIKIDDELSIQHLATKQAFVSTFSWDAAQTVDTLLFNIAVSPMHRTTGNNGGTTYTNGTPSWMVSHMFNYWRGDIIFRFKIVASMFHRGRLLFSWDPYGAISSTTNTSNTVFTRLVDITEEKDIEIIVPYTQNLRYLSCTNSANRYGTGPLTATAGAENGILTVRVLNEQTSSNADADINIICFVKCHDNIEFADPTSQKLSSDGLSIYLRQSQDVVFDTQEKHMALECSKAPLSTNLLHMGENVTSLRQLIRRVTLHRKKLYYTHVNTAMNSYSSTFARMPLYYGWDSRGIDSATNSVPATANFNFVLKTPLDWIGACFVGNRGSVNWYINCDYNNANYNTQSVERNVTELLRTEYARASSVGQVNQSSMPRAGMIQYQNGLSGRMVADSQQQKCLNVAVPYYNNLRFSSNNPAYRTEGSSTDNTLFDSLDHVITRYITTSSSADNIDVSYHCSAGVDFSFVFFLNVPTYSGITLPNAA
nr:MAG: capsid protein [Crogonang virus 122]